MTALVAAVLVAAVLKMLLYASMLAVMDFPVTARTTRLGAALGLLTCVAVATWATVLLIP